MGLSIDLPVALYSGFLLMNLEWMRTHQTAQACLDFLATYHDQGVTDEFALNYHCADAIRPLPQGWGSVGDVCVSHPRLGCIHYNFIPPTKVKFNRRWGFNDSYAIWMKAVRVLFGKSVTEACGVPAWKWILGRCYNHILRFIVPLCEHLPLLRDTAWVRSLRCSFVPWCNRWRLSRCLWTARWHGNRQDR